MATMSHERPALHPPAPAAVAVAIFLSGLAGVLAFVTWAAGESGSSPATAPRAALAAAPAVTAAAAAPAAHRQAMASAPAMSMPAAHGASAGAASAATGAPHTPYDATLPPVGPGTEHHLTLSLKDVTFEIAPGVRYQGWTFSGGAPGPVIHVRQGDTVDLTLRNDSVMPHSIDFHAARIAPSRAFADVAPGQAIHFSFVANDPGVFMYHCGTAPVLAHIANGMYGAIVVDPKGGLPPVDHSFVLVASEWYLNGDGTTTPASLSMDKARHMQPDWMTFNGYAGQYKDNPLQVQPGDSARFYVVDAGPSLNTEFHVVGTLFDTVWEDGTTTDTLHDVQTVTVPAGGGMVFDTHFGEPGLYPFVSHSFAAADMGMVGLVRVGDVQGTMSH